jgi:hypothetical protein
MSVTGNWKLRAEGWELNALSNPEPGTVTMEIPYVPNFQA